MDDPSPLACLATLVAVIVVVSVSSKKKDKSNIPWAPGAAPILGHALKYRQSPVRFLINARAKAGDIFQVNLAGKRMVIACGPRLQRSIASAPESIMSARTAVANVGFEEMLGFGNVHRGTDLHKGIIKGVFRQTNENDKGIVLGLIEALRDAFKVETRASSCLEKFEEKVDFMTLIRTITLRAVVEYFIGRFFLKGWTDFDFIVEYMKFQDDLEDATAKSAVLPRTLALPLFLWPLRMRRLKLERVIRKRLEDTLTQSTKKELGFWLSAVKDIRSLSLGDIAHYIVGLLFAGHKNPAIGAAQSYLMLQEHGTSKEKIKCVQESQQLMLDPTYRNLQEACPLLNRLCLETLRLTAHSIGGLRISGKEFSIGDNFVIEKGRSVALAHIPTSLDAGIWTEPGTLNLNASSNRPMDLYEDDYAFTVFSHGIHKCPGQRLAMVMLPCTIAILLTEYIVKIPEKIPPLCFERATLAQRSGPVFVTITQKNQEK